MNYAQLLRICVAGASYFCFAIFLTFYNKWLLKDFHFPLFTTGVHFCLQFIFTGLCRLVYQLIYGKSRIVLDWPTYIKRIFPAGIFSALDIGLSNWSFIYITVSLYTMSKTTCIIFVLMFAIILGLEKPRITTVVVVICIGTGLFLFTYHSTNFVLIGFIIVMSASFLGGLRWNLVQIVTQKEAIGLSNPIDTTFHIAPVMALGLVLPALYLEGIPLGISKEVFDFQTYTTLESTIVKILVGGFVACFLTITEYLFLSYTSSLTLSIIGIIKEITILLLAAEVNKDKISVVNWIGAAICIFGIGAHVFNKYTKQLAHNSKSDIDNSKVGNGLLDTTTTTDESEVDLYCAQFHPTVSRERFKENSESSL